MKLNKTATITGIIAAVFASSSALVYGIERFITLESTVEELAGESVAGKLQRAREQVKHYERLMRRRSLSSREMKDYRYWSRRVIELEGKLRRRG